MRSEKTSRFLSLGTFVVLGILISSVGSVALVTTGARISTDTMQHVTIRQVADQGKPWINLSDGIELSSAFTGTTGMEYVLKHGLAQPLALAAADFDEDGVPDLIAGYAGPGGGLLTLHRGNIHALWPNGQGRALSVVRSPLQQTTDNGQLTTDAPPFLLEVHVFAVEAAPDFLGAGDFDADGHWDVVAAARGSQSLHLLRGDGRGGLSKAEPIALPGRVTALIVGELNRRDGLDDVIVAVGGAKGPQALVFESPQGALNGMNAEQETVRAAVPGRPRWGDAGTNAGGHREPPVQRWTEALPLPAEATALALGQLDDSFEMDLAVAAGSELLIVHGRDRKLSIADCGLQIADCSPQQPPLIKHQSFDFTITSLAVGDFIWDREHRTDIALLGDDGQVHLLSSEDGKDDAGGHRGPPRQEGATASVGATVSGRPPSGVQLLRAKVSSFPTDDLMVINQANHQLHIISDLRPNQSAIRNPQSEILSADGVPVAVLPMRLNADALSDLVIVREGSSAPTVMLTAAAMTFTVNSTADDDDGDCNGASGDCTLREAILAANANPGADTIEFNIGTGTPTINVGASTGKDLPTITEAVTIAGNTGGATRVELNGTSATTASNPAFDRGAFNINATGCVVRNMVVNRFADDAIEMQMGSNIIEGSFIGTDVTGTLDRGSTFEGVFINGAPNNRIGGTTAEARNVISGNNDIGVVIAETGATGNLVQGNYIGTDVTGTLDVGNTRDGVLILRSGGNTIGGTTAGSGNLISGNNNRAVRISSTGATGNLVQGNFMGVNAAGTAALGNGAPFGVPVGGVLINGVASNTIGGTSPNARNVISGNSFSSTTAHGVFISGSGATLNLVQGNIIGLDAAGATALPNSGDGVFISGPSNTVGGTTMGAGNLISGNSGALSNGVHISGTAATGNQVQGNLIGTDITGALDRGNSRNGVSVEDASNTQIGGTTTAARNVISGNNNMGILLFGTSATNNVVQGNYIGVGADGMTDIGNSLSGIQMSGTSSTAVSSSNTIGGTTPGARNIIAGNDQTGVSIGGSNNVVQGNYIGIAADGTTAVGNGFDGVSLTGVAANNMIGGTTPEARNIISANGQHGVSLFGSSFSGQKPMNNTVQGNYIGTTANGMTGRGNQKRGVSIIFASNNTIGGTASGAGNVISANGTDGVGFVDTATDNIIQGNLIGTNVTGMGPLGNSGSGINLSITASNNIIGGTDPGAGNTIAFNGSAGAMVSSGTSNRILGNSIHSNTGLGIDLGSAGVTANDAGDGDTGPNNLQNFPALTTISSTNSTTTISGTLDSTANATFRIEFFSNTACDPSGNGEGQTFIGSASVMTNGSGIATINVALPVAVPDTRFITATATDPSNNTSEFSQCFGSITIIKDAIPNHAQDFSFSGTLGDFLLDDDADATLPNQLTFMTLAPGSYTVTEGALAGWSLTSLACTDPDSGSTVSLGTRTATIDLDVGEMITCTFTNTKLGTITIIKDAVPNDSQDFAFSGTLGDFTLDGDAADGTLPNTRTFTDLNPGAYTVTEAAVAGWTLTNLVCNDPDHGSAVNLTTRTATIDLDAGETVTCTFTNTRQAANVLILQDERNGNRLCIDLDTGAYKFETRSHGTFTGTAIVKLFGLYITFNSGPTDANRLSGNTYSTRGQAVLRAPGGRPVFTIRDRDITNNGPCS